MTDFGVVAVARAREVVGGSLLAMLLGAGVAAEGGRVCLSRPVGINNVGIDSRLLLVELNYRARRSLRRLACLRDVAPLNSDVL